MNLYYLTEEDIKKEVIPELEKRVDLWNQVHSNIVLANKSGISIKGEFMKIGDLVECIWANGVVNHGIVKEFGSTFEGEIFPILFECKKDLSPKKKVILSTWLVCKNMVVIKKKNPTT